MKEVYEQYYTQLVYFGLKLVKNNQVVEDIVVDCIIKFFEKGYRLSLANVILYKCVKHSCLNYMRSQERREKINTALFDEEYIELQVIESGVLNILSEALNKLPIDCRQVIIMYYLEEKTCVQIAGLLNKSPATVRSLKRHGLNKLVSLKQLK